MKKKTIIILVIIVVIIIIGVIINKNNQRRYARTYQPQSIGKTFVDSAARGAGSYAGYHVAKNIFGHKSSKASSSKSYSKSSK